MHAVNDGILELGVFRLKDGVTREQFLGTVDAVSEWAGEQPGFVSRDLVEGDDGQWADVVWWETRDDAEAATAAAYMSDRCLAMFGMIDMDGLLFLHGRHAIPPVARRGRAA